MKYVCESIFQIVICYAYKQYGNIDMFYYKQLYLNYLLLFLHVNYPFKEWEDFSGVYLIKTDLIWYVGSCLNLDINKILL